jgi:hypothetical protein
MENDLKIGGITGSASDLTALQSLKHVICLTPRMLTASEIKLLRQSKVEIAQRVSELAGLHRGSNPAAEKATEASFLSAARVSNREIRQRI